MSDKIVEGIVRKMYGDDHSEPASLDEEDGCTYTAKDLADDLIEVMKRHNKPENTRLLLDIMSHLRDCELLDP